MTRQEYNKQIVEKLNELIDKYPNQRFGQILVNYVFPEMYQKDIFFTESSETLTNIIGL